MMHKKICHCVCFITAETKSLKKNISMICYAIMPHVPKFCPRAPPCPHPPNPDQCLPSPAIAPLLKCTILPLSKKLKLKYMLIQTKLWLNAQYSILALLCAIYIRQTDLLAFGRFVHDKQCPLISC